MMKKVLFGLSAIIALFATSCQNDLDIFGTNAGKSSAVTFNVATPEIATRAFSDGKTAKTLQYAIYDSEGQHLSDLDGQKPIDMTATIELQLTTGENYTMLFWASNDEAPYTFNPETKSVSVDYAAAKTICNDEKRDAFFARHDFRVNGKQNEVVELYRPFAQLNIGTNDYEAAKKSGYEPTLSALTVKNIYSTLNLFDGSVETPTEVVYDYSAIPTSETFPVENYDYLSMNYLLVAPSKEVVEIELGYKEADTDAKTRIIGSVPVQRNYRTNIYGQLFTSNVGFNVQIVPAYNEPANNISSDDLYLAAAIGGNISLTEDVELPTTLLVQSSLVLNLNGKTLKNKADNTATDVIIVSGDATLTINGEGTVEAVSGNDGYAVIVKDNAKVVINGGTFKAGTDADGAANAVIYVRGNGKAYVNGGNFPNECNSAYVLNKKDADRATTTIEVKGGTFTGFNPADNTAEGAGTNFVAEGYAVSADGNIYTVNASN